MSDQTNRDEARRQRLDEVIGSYLVALDAGRSPDPREWLARHPDLCPELADFFADRAAVDDLIDPMRVEGRPDGEPLAATLDQGVMTDGPGPPDGECVPTSEDDRAKPLPRGTQVRYFGDYELGRVLGEGGMGIVYKARQLSLNRPVALKMIKAAAVRLRRRAPPVPERGRGRRPARPPQHRADLRGRPVRGPALFQHEADRG